MMIKEEVLKSWKNRMAAAQSEIKEEIEPELQKRRYEQEITQRLLAKAQDEADRQTWQIQLDVLQTMLVLAENHRTEQEEEVALCRTMITEIEADLEGGA